MSKLLLYFYSSVRAKQLLRFTLHSKERLEQPQGRRERAGVS